MEARFYLQNLFLGIATVDRDREPLKFDERLKDTELLVGKIAHCVESKLRVFFLLLDETDIDAALNKIARDAEQYERVRTWTFYRKRAMECLHRL